MNLSFFEKIGLVFNYLTSSIMTIELLLIVILLFSFIFLNIKYKNKYINMISYTLPLLFLLIIIVFNKSFVIGCIDSFIKSLMYYYYFPNIALYFIIIVFVTGILIYTILSKKIIKEKRIINYSLFSIIYLNFILLISYISTGNVILVLDNSMYKDNLVLSLIQLSNLVLIIWIVITIFYYIYNYINKKIN